MVSRIGRVVGALALVVGCLAMDATPAAAANPLTSTMFCGYSSGLGYAVGFYGPQVTGEIGGSDGSPAFVRWKPELYWYNFQTRQWTFWKSWTWRSAELYTTAGPGSLGGTTGTAGPSWYGSDGWNNQFYFDAPPGYWYAVKQVFYDRGVWSSTWAQTQAGAYMCSY